ncbi:SMI1/KNR4 family protein [Pseudoduganella chitinolytica]|uniref:SMI1/KNR4 family protein n=1 Tax=Pseudoduganella chitinolytica TaxID=34070 RepID=A0ABY8BD15_9BURK|nr:SMI1/KNR4 family protein [Pseudoduganella chitinolytica]WEF32878.1 SMI1/KNR4 family protein [Pseudoduganella chitinolytica]
MDEIHLEGFKANEGTSLSNITQAEQMLHYAIPEDYRKFLETYNGGEGFIGEIYVILWRCEELPNFNQQYEVADYADGLLLIGSNGGGEAIAYDMRHSPPEIVEIPFVGMDLQYARLVAHNFTEFINPPIQKP